MKKDPSIDSIVEILRNSQHILFITGAGLSADSGLSTYRGIGGLYNDQATEEGIPIEEALSGQMMASRPEFTWKYLARLIQSCLGARYNRGHEVIAETAAFDLKQNGCLAVAPRPAEHKQAAFFSSRHLLSDVLEVVFATEEHPLVFDRIADDVWVGYRLKGGFIFSRHQEPPAHPPAMGRASGPCGFAYSARASQF